MSTEYETFIVSVDDKIAHVQINRPDRANAMNRRFWDEIKQIFDWIDDTGEVRAAVLSGIGKHFCAGIDLAMFDEGIGKPSSCDGRRRENLRREILRLQGKLSAIETCRKPVLAAIHGVCYGGGIDMSCCCDIRYCTVDARFSIKEIDIGMTADVGTLQRLPHIIGDGIMRELAYTGREFLGSEAKDIGYVNQAFENKELMMDAVMGLAGEIAAKSPLSIRGTKEMIVYSRDHSVHDGLDHIATWNAGMLMSDDLHEAMTAKLEKRMPRFKD